MPDEDNRENCDSTSNTRRCQYGITDIKCQVVTIWHKGHKCQVVPKCHKLGQRLVLCDLKVKLMMYCSQKLCTPISVTFIYMCQFGTPGL